MKFLAFVLTSCALVSAVYANQDSTHPHFLEVKGDHEFTGQMIARPKQLLQLMNEGSAFKAISRRQQTETLASGQATAYRAQLDEYVLNVPKGMTEDQYAAKLLASGDFQYVEPNWRVFIVSGTNDPLYPQQWHLPKIQADLAWNMFVGNNSIIVALTDTGIRLDHEDLHDELVSGYNSWTGTAQVDGGDVNDTHGHGTHTAGIAGAIGNNGLGVSGVCQHVRLMPIKVVSGSSGSSTISALTDGAIWAADHGARVVSTSFSGFDSSSTVQTAGDYIKHTRNGLYCWAAGNDGRNLTSGDWADVTVVGASDSSDLRASFSAFGTAIDVFAPGVNIISTYDNATNGYASLSGTSMATPCAAGVGAMILMANPSLTGQQVEDILYHTCDNIGSSATFGWGRVNLKSCLLSVYNTTTFSPVTATVLVGQATSGGVAQLGSMNSQFLNVTVTPRISSTSPSGIQIQYDTYTTISSIGSITLTHAGLANSANIVQKTELYDWSANSWVTLDSRIALQTDTAITMNPSNPNRFKDATGLMRARVTYQKLLSSAGSPLFQVSVDQVAFLTAP